MQKKFTSIVGLAIIAAIVLAVNLLGSILLPSLKFDITEDKIYTLSKGSKNIAAALEDPVSAKFYYSKTAVAEVPAIKEYANRVLAMLKEYEDASKNVLKLEIIDPRPDTEEEAEAERSGLQGVPIDANTRVFLGLVLRDKGTGKETRIPFFEPSKESSLEYDISKALYSIAHSKKKTIGIVSSLPVLGAAPPPQQNPMARPPSPTPAWAFVQKLQSTFRLIEVAPSVDKISADIDLLLIIHPKDLAQPLQYAIDQFVLGGGQAIVFVDPMCQMDQQALGNNPQAMMQASLHSSMPELLKAWGVEMVAGEASTSAMGGMMPSGGGPKVVADMNLAEKVRMQDGSVGEMPVWMRLQQANFTTEKEKGNDTDIITNGLNNLMMVTAGALQITAPSDRVKAEPLIQTTKEGGAIDSFMLKFGLDPEQLRQALNKVESRGVPLTLAYKLTGKFNTAFPEGKPAAADGAASAKSGKHLTESAEASTLIVIADVDMISDGYCVRMMQTPFGNMAQPLNDNINFVYNASENLSGSEDLISLRTRGRSQRPFTRVQEIQSEAQAKWRDKEEELNKELQAAEASWQQFQKSTNDAQVLTSELTTRRKELLDARQKINKQLVEVRRNLREDVERLGFQLKFINIALIPLLVVAIGLVIAFVRATRRRDA